MSNRTERRGLDVPDFPPRMSEAEEKLAWQEYWAMHSDAARNRIVESHLSLAAWALQKFPGLARLYPTREEAFSVAAAALMGAVERFDSDRGMLFSTFAVSTIRGELLNGLGRARIRGIIARINKACCIFLAEHGRQPDEQELAELTGLSAAQIDNARAAGRITHPGSMNAPLSTDGGTLGDLLFDRSAIGPGDFIREAEAGAFLRRLLVGLKPIFRKVIWLHFFAGKKYREIATMAGVTHQRVYQVRDAALAELQSRYAAAYRRWAGIDAMTILEAEVRTGRAHV